MNFHFAFVLFSTVLSKTYMEFLNMLLPPRFHQQSTHSAHILSLRPLTYQNALWFTDKQYIGPNKRLSS